MQRAPLAKVSLKVSGIVPYQSSEVWKLVRCFGGAGEWLGLVSAEQASSQLLVRARMRDATKLLI